MSRFHLRRNYLKTMAYMFLFLPACASLPEDTPQNTDPIIEAVQEENREIVSNQIAFQKALEDVYDRINALDAKVDVLETQTQALSDSTQLAVMPSQPPPGSTEEGEDKKAEPTPPAAKQKESSAIKKTSKKIQGPAKTNAMEQYDKAYATYTGQRYEEALALFKSFVQDHPQHDLADNAQYWIGEIHYDMENYQGALLAFEEVTKKYADRNKAPDALLKMGYCYMALDDPTNAQLFLKRVIKNYPFSEAEAKAREKLIELGSL